MSRQTSGDLSEGGDLRSEIEENRQYLIRALRAVEATTVECRKEAWSATAKASRLEEAFDAQSETIRDLREQLFASLTQLKDRKIDRAPVGTSEEIGLLTERLRQVESEVAQASKSNTSKLKALHHAQKDLNADTAARFQRSDSSLDRMLQAFEAQEQRFEELMHSSQVRIDAQITNSDSLTALRLDDMEQRFRKQISQLQGSEKEAQNKPAPVFEDPGKLSSIIERLDQNEKKLNSCLQQLEKNEQEVGRLKTERQMDRDNTAGVLDFESQRIRKQDESIVRMEGSQEEMLQGLFAIQAKLQALQDFGDQLQRSHQAVLASQLEAQPSATAESEKLRGKIDLLEQRLEEVSAGLDGLGGWMKSSLNEAGMKSDADEKGGSFVEIAALKHAMHQLQVDSDRMKSEHGKMLTTVNGICEDMLKLAPRDDLKALTDQNAGILNSLELVRDAVSENSPFATKKTVKNLAAQTSAEAKTMIDSLQTQLEELKSAQGTMDKELLELRYGGSFVAQARDDVSVQSSKPDDELAQRLQVVEAGLRATRADVAAGELKTGKPDDELAQRLQVVEEGLRAARAESKTGKPDDELAQRLQVVEEGLRATRAELKTGKPDAELAQRLQVVEEGLRATRADVAAGESKTGKPDDELAQRLQVVEEGLRATRAELKTGKPDAELAQRLQVVEEGLRATRSDVAAGELKTITSSEQAKEASGIVLEELQRDLRELENKVEEWAGRQDVFVAQIRSGNLDLSVDQMGASESGMEKSSGPENAANDFMMEEVRRGVRELGRKVQVQEERQDKVEEEVKELGFKINLSSEVAQLVDGFDEQRKPVRLTLDRNFDQWNQDLEDGLKGTICDIAPFLAPWQINIVNLSPGSVVVDFLIRSDRWKEAIAALSQDFGSEESLLKKRARAIILVAPEAADRSKIDSMEEDAAEEVGKQIQDQGEKLDALSRLVESMSDGVQLGSTKQVGIEEIVSRLEQLEASFKSVKSGFTKQAGVQEIITRVEQLEASSKSVKSDFTKQAGVEEIIARVEQLETSFKSALPDVQRDKRPQNTRKAEVAGQSGLVEQQVIRELSGKVETMEWELRAMRADVGSVEEWKESVTSVKASAMESSRIVLDLDQKLDRLGKIETILLPALHKKIEVMEKSTAAKQERGFVALMQKEVSELEGKVKGVDVELETAMRSVADQSAEAEGLKMADLANNNETLKSLERLDKSVADLEEKMSELDEKAQDQRGAVQQTLRDFARRMEVLETGLQRVESVHGAGGAGGETSRSDGDWVTEELQRGVRELGRRMHELATRQELMGEEMHGVRTDLDRGGGDLLATKMQLDASISDVERRLQPLLVENPQQMAAGMETEKLVRELAGKVEGMEWELRAIRAEVGSVASQSGTDKGQTAVADTARSPSDSDALLNLLTMKVDELTLKQEDLESVLRIVSGSGGQWEEENQSWLLELAQRVQALEVHGGIPKREEELGSRSEAIFTRADLGEREEVITEIRRLAKELTDKVVVVECELLSVKVELKKGDTTSTLDGSTAEQLQGEITACKIQLQDFGERFALLNALSQSQASLEQAVEDLKRGGDGLNREESDKSSLDADPWEYATKIDRIEQQLKTLSPLKGPEGLGFVEDIKGLQDRLQYLEQSQEEIDRKLAALPDRVGSLAAPQSAGISELVVRSSGPGHTSLPLDSGQSPTVISSELGFMRPSPSMISQTEDPVQQTLFERAAVDDDGKHEGSSTASEAPEEEDELPQIDLASIHALLASPATMFQDTIPPSGGGASYAGSSAMFGESTSYEVEGRGALREDSGVSYEYSGVSYQDSGVSYQDSGVSYQDSGALEAEASTMTISVDPSPARTLGLPSIAWSQRAGRSMGRSLQSQGLQSVAEWPLHEDDEKDQMLKTLELLQNNLETRMDNLKARAAEELQEGTNTEMDEESSGQLRQLSKDMQDLSRSLQGEALADSALFGFGQEKRENDWEVNQLSSTTTGSFVNEYPGTTIASVEEVADDETEFDSFKLETSQERIEMLKSLETVQALLAKKAQLLAGKEDGSSDGGETEEDGELRGEIQRLVGDLTDKVQTVEDKLRFVRGDTSALPDRAKTALPEGITSHNLMKKVQDHEERLLLLKTLESAQLLLENKLDSLEIAQGNTSVAAGGGLADIQSKLQELLGKVEAQGMKQVSVEGELATLHERMHSSFQASPFHASASGVEGTMSGHRGAGPDATPGFMESFISHVTPDRNRPGTFLESALTSDIPVARLQERVLMLERAFQDRDGERFTADGGEVDDNDAGVEERLSRLELALIEVLENRSVSIVGDDGAQLSKRLEKLEQSLTGIVPDEGGLEVSSGGSPTKPWVQSHKELMKKVDSLDKKLAIAGPIFGQLGHGSPGDLQDQGSIKAATPGTDVDASGDGTEVQHHHKNGIGRKVEEQGLRQMVIEEEVRALRVEMEEVSLSMRSDPRLAVPCVPISQYQQQLQQTRTVLRSLSSGEKKGAADAATVDQVRECLESCVTQLLNLAQYIASQDSATERQRENIEQWRDNVQQLCLSECRSQLSELSDAVSRLWTVVSPRPDGDGSSEGPFATAASVHLMEQGLLSALEALNSNFAELQKEVKEIPAQGATTTKVEETTTTGVQPVDIPEDVPSAVRPESGMGLPHGESLTTLSGSAPGHGGISEEVCAEICELRFNELSRPLLSDLEDRIDGACKAAQETAADNEELKQSLEKLKRDMNVLRKQLRATLEGVSLPPSDAGQLSDPELPTTVEAIPTETADTHTADDLADSSALRDAAQEVSVTLSGPRKKLHDEEMTRGDSPSIDGTELQEVHHKLKRLEVSVDMLINKFTAHDVAVDQLQRDSEVLSVENAMMQEFQDTMRNLEVQGDQLEVKLNELALANRQHDVQEMRQAVQKVEEFEKILMERFDEESKSPAKKGEPAKDTSSPLLGRIAKQEELQGKQASSEQAAQTALLERVAAVEGRVAELDSQLVTELEKTTSKLEGKLASSEQAAQTALSERVAAIEGRVAELDNQLVTELEKTTAKLEQALPVLAGMGPANEALERRVEHLEEDLSKAITDKAELQEQIHTAVEDEVRRAGESGAEDEKKMASQLDMATRKLEASLPALADSMSQAAAAQEQKLAALEEKLGKAVDRLEPVEKQTASIDTVVQNLLDQITSLEKNVAESKLEAAHVDEGVQTGEETPRTRMVQLEGRLDQHHALLRQIEAMGDDLVQKEAEKDTRIQSLEATVSKIAELEAGKADQAKLLELEAMVAEHKQKLAEIEEDFEKADEAPWEERLSTLERSALGEQSKQPRIGVLESKLAELDEAMEVRENENAELDGRVKDMELQEALTKKRLLRLDSLEGRCDALGDEISTVRLYVDENFVKKQELRPVERQVALLTAHDRVMQQASTLSPVVMADVTPARDVRSNQVRSPGEDGSWGGADLDNELSIASEGSARIRALAARVRGVTQARTGMPAIPTSPQDHDGHQESSSQSNSPQSPQISPRSRLEDTAEKIRMWEVRNQDAEEGHDPLTFA